MVHDIEAARLVNGMPIWTCACGKVLYSYQGAKRHLAVADGSWLRPWPGRWWR
jgi:hypothetical protein